MHVVNAAVLARGNALTDEQVVADVLDGQTALFEVLMRRYNERMYRVARSIVRDDAEAEDIMQQAYVNAYTNLHQFKGQAQFSTWLTRIAIHESLLRVRRKKRYEPFGEETSNVELIRGQGCGDPERQAASGELRALLESAIERLPDGAREVFVLRDVEGMSTLEAAQSLDVSEDVVKTRLFRARSALRRDLLKRTGTSAPDVFRFYRPRCDRMVSEVLSRIAR
jgi:RNA polymerase sigma-70 factor, ECF subfamily